MADEVRCQQTQSAESTRCSLLARDPQRYREGKIQATYTMAIEWPVATENYLSMLTKFWAAGFTVILAPSLSLNVKRKLFKNLFV